MQYLAIFLKVVPFAINLIGIAEEVFSEKPKTGPEKKAFVMETIRQVIAAMLAGSTGGQAETWKEVDTVWKAIEGFLSTMIDKVCGILFDVHTAS